jgi:hypothetical protein
MARRSILAPALDTQQPEGDIAAALPAPAATRERLTKPSREAKLHIGGYYDPSDPIVIAFQKLRIDLRKPQQEMLMDAIRDYVAKHEAEGAFR